MALTRKNPSSIGSLMAEQWIDYYYAPAMSKRDLIISGKKKTGPNSSNIGGNPDVITNGSKFVVNEGQCAITVENGKVLGIYKEAGEYTFNSEYSKSVFEAGGLSNLAEEGLHRLSYGNDTALVQRIYYINLLEIDGNYISTIGDIPIRVVSPQQNLDIDAALKINGQFSFCVTDPETFYRSVAGNVEYDYYTSTFKRQLEKELMDIIAEIAAKMTGEGLRPFEVTKIYPEFEEEVTRRVNEVITPLRGIRIFSLSFGIFRVSQDTSDVVKKIQWDSVLSPNATTPSMLKWKCKCGNLNNGNFCTQCGSPKEDIIGKQYG